MHKTWSDEQIEFLKANAAIYNDVKMTEQLSKTFEKDFTLSAVRKKRQRLKITKEAHRGYFKLKNIE